MSSSPSRALRGSHGLCDAAQGELEAVAVAAVRKASLDMRAAGRHPVESDKAAGRHPVERDTALALANYESALRDWKHQQAASVKAADRFLGSRPSVQLSIEVEQHLSEMGRHHKWRYGVFRLNPMGATKHELVSSASEMGRSGCGWDQMAQLLASSSAPSLLALFDPNTVSQAASPLLPISWVPSATGKERVLLDEAWREVQQYFANSPEFEEDMMGAPMVVGTNAELGHAWEGRSVVFDCPSIVVRCS